MKVETGQLWRRKSDGAHVVVEEASGYSNFIYSLVNHRHFYVTNSGLLKKYELIDPETAGLDVLADAAFGPVKNLNVVRKEEQ